MERIYRRHIRLDAHGRQWWGAGRRRAALPRAPAHDGAACSDRRRGGAAPGICADALDAARSGHAALAPLHRRGNVADARHTHWFDLAGLAVAHAAAGRASREYRCAVWGAPDADAHATLERDGEPLLAWRLEGMTIRGSPMGSVSAAQ
jgi:hypothetical protein